MNPEPDKCAWTHNVLLRGKVFKQGFAETFLLIRSELAAGRTEIKDVDGRLAFCLDQGDVDVAVLV